MVKGESRRAAGRMPRAWEGLTLVVMLWVGATASVRTTSPGSAGSGAGQQVFYVAPTGSDAWSGRRLTPNAGKTDGPFATVARARDAVRQLKAAEGGLRQPVTVFIRGGTYFLHEPIIFTPEDSGTARCPVSYAAYHNEPVVISGGRRITGWKPVTAEGKRLWAAPIPEAREGQWFFRQLWVNGQRRFRARHPHKGYLRVASVPDAAPQTPWQNGQTSFEFHPGDLSARLAAGGAEVVVMNRWVESHLPITGVDKARHRVTC